MIGGSKNNRQNYPRRCFWTQEKETRVKFNPRLSANPASNNWAQYYNRTEITVLMCLLKPLRSDNDPPYDPTTARLKNRLRVLYNFFALIPSHPVTWKKRSSVGTEERGPRPISERKSKIYRLAVPVLTLQLCRGGKEMYQKAWCTCRVVVLLIKPTAFLTFPLPSPS